MATESQAANDLLSQQLGLVIDNLPRHEYEALVLTSVTMQIARVATALERIADSLAPGRAGEAVPGATSETAPESPPAPEVPATP